MVGSINDRISHAPDNLQMNEKEEAIDEGSLLLFVNMLGWDGPGCKHIRLSYAVPLVEACCESDFMSSLVSVFFPVLSGIVFEKQQRAVAFLVEEEDQRLPGDT